MTPEELKEKIAELKTLMVQFQEKNSEMEKKIDNKTSVDEANLKAMQEKMDKLEEEIQKKNSLLTHGINEEKAFNLVKYLKGIAGFGWDKDFNKDLITKMNPKTKMSVKAILDESTGSYGHYLIPDEFSADYVQLLYKNLVFDRLPVRRMMPSGGDTLIPILSSGSTAYWVASGAALTESTPVFGQLELNPHKIGAFVPVAGELIRRSDPEVISIVREDMISQVASEVEKQIINGTGTTMPYGILDSHWSSINSVSMGTDGGKFSANDNLNRLFDIIEDVEEDNGKGTHWLLNTRTKHDLRRLIDGNDNYIITVNNNEGDPPMLLGYPYYTTENILNTYTQGGKSDTSQMIFGDFSKMAIAVWTEVTIDASNQASYVTSGTTYSCFQRDEVAIRLFMEVDSALRNQAAFGKIVGIRTTDAT